MALFKLESAEVDLAVAVTLKYVGIAIESKIPIIKITTKSSINVKPDSEDPPRESVGEFQIKSLYQNKHALISHTYPSPR
jgi:hypothetical protein